MKTLKQRLIAIAALTCVAMTSFVSCADTSSSSSSSNTAADVASDGDIEIVTNDEGLMIAAPFQVITPEDGKVSFNDIDFNAPDPTRASTTEAASETTGSTASAVVTDANGQPATEFVEVTDSNNQPVTEMVKVTDASGQVVTEADGKEVTSAVAVTQAVPVTEAATQGGNQATDASQGNSEASEATQAQSSDSNYQSKTESKYIFWIDIGKDVDFKFNGQFVKITFKVKDGTPDGEYPITIDPDISTVDGKSLNRQLNVLNGTIKVGGTIDPQDIKSDGITVYADNISAKAGDTIDYYINIKNNPGAAALMMWFSYDANALELQKVKACGEFADIANAPEVGGSKKK